MREIEFLKKRAKEFFERALEDFEKRRFNLAAFDLEQSVQLSLKYLIAKKIHDWPKTHWIEDLIAHVGELYGNEKIRKYEKEKSWFIDELSNAYFISRYFPKEYSEETVKTMIDETKELLMTLEDISEEKILD